MNMELTNREILTADRALGKLIQEKFPYQTSFAIVKLSKKLREPLETFDEVRQSLVKKYAITQVKNDDDISILKSEQKDGVEKYTAEVEALADEKIKVTVEAIKLPDSVSSTCDKCHHNMDKQFEIEPVVLMALGNLIKE